MSGEVFIGLLPDAGYKVSKFGGMTSAEPEVAGGHAGVRLGQNSELACMPT